MRLAFCGSFVHYGPARIREGGGVAGDDDDEVVEGRRPGVLDVEVESDLSAEGHLLDVVGGRADQRAEN